eukprot:gene8333-157_t
MKTKTKIGVGVTIGITSILLLTFLCILLALFAFLLTVVIVMIVFSIPIAPTAEALRLIQGDSTIKVEYKNNWWIFSNRNVTKDGGLIFYPGGRIDPRAYAPLLHNISSMTGYSCYLTQFPFHTSFFGIFNADTALNEVSPNTTQWVISGHSLGGTGVSYYMDDVIKKPSKNRNKIKGAIFYASYSITDIRSFTNEVLLMYGSRDGQIGYESRFRDTVPKNSTVYIIQGGNHKQFGSYVEKNIEDFDATISEQQQRLIIANQTSYYFNTVFN